MVVSCVLYSPAQVARTLLKNGDDHAAVTILRAAVVRDPTELGCAEMLAGLEDRISGQFGDRTSQRMLPVSQAVVDDWISQGMMIEALALLLTKFEGARLEWATLLGELLAPIPARSHSDFVDVHDHLMRGSASLALASLQDRKNGGKVMPQWALRRLELLQWLLIDNAPVAERDSVAPDPSANELSILIREGIARRSFSALVIAVEDYAERNPQNAGAIAAQRALSTMLQHLSAVDDAHTMSAATMPISGPLAGMTQLRMLNFEMAKKLFTRMRAFETSIPVDELIAAIEVIQASEVGETSSVEGEDEAPSFTKPVARRGFVEEVVTRETDTRGLFRSLNNSSVRTRAPMIDAATSVTDLSSLASSMEMVEEPTRIVELPELTHPPFSDEELTTPGAVPSAIQKLRDAESGSLGIDVTFELDERDDTESFEASATLPVDDQSIAKYVERAKAAANSVVIRKILIVKES